MGAFFSANSMPYFVANGVSAGCTLIVVAVAVWLRTKGHVNRASLMLQAGISLVDLARHIRLFFNSSDDQFLCTAMAAFSFFGDHLHMLLNVAIAANLHHIYLLGKTPGALWHLMVYLKAITHTSSYQALNLTPRGPSFGIYNSLVNQFATRIALYPFSCFISHFGFMAMGFTYDFTNHISPFLLSLGLFLQSTTGVVNLICLCFDPSLIEMLKRKFQVTVTEIYPSVPWGHGKILTLEAAPQTILSSPSSSDQVQTLTVLLEQF
ncbi:hypothetical protein L0F63_004640 [Massospora cicadina]|nr:hypothetical protein L0F63_004640 [Massospora cicadina]